MGNPYRFFSSKELCSPNLSFPTFPKSWVYTEGTLSLISKD